MWTIALLLHLLSRHNADSFPPAAIYFFTSFLVPLFFSILSKMMFSLFINNTNRATMNHNCYAVIVPPCYQRVNRFGCQSCCLLRHSVWTGEQKVWCVRFSCKFPYRTFTNKLKRAWMGDFPSSLALNSKINRQMSHLMSNSVKFHFNP